MTEIFSDGFESNDFTAWDGTGGDASDTAEVVSTDPHHGSYHAKFTLDGTDYDYKYCYESIGDQAEVYLRAYVQFKTAFPDSGERYQTLNLRRNDWIGIAIVKNDGGTIKWGLRYYDGAAAQESLAASPNPSLDTWYCVEIYEKIHASAGEVSLWVDGSQLINVQNLDTNNLGNINLIRVGEGFTDPGPTAHIVYVDCVVVADAYIGPEVAGQPYISRVQRIPGMMTWGGIR